MRIIAGLRRGHRFEGPLDRDTRPTSDLVREALFNILRETIDGLVVVDLFAGTGALGLEALSRGATRATFVERHRSNADRIRANLATLKFEDRGAVVHADAYRWARGYRASDAEPIVVFIDPPWVEFERRAAEVRQLLVDLLERVPEGSTIVLESGDALDEAVLPETEEWDRRRYGGTHVAICVKGGVPEEDEGEPEGPDEGADAGP